MELFNLRRILSNLLVLSSAVDLTTKATIIPADPSKDILWPYYTFETVDFTPPVLNITQYSPPSEGYLFFAPDGATPYQIAPLIMDVNGELVWNGPLEHAFNFGVYEYNGESVLAWWNGTLFPEPVGRGNGLVYIYNNQYELINTVTLPGNFLELEPGIKYPSNIDVHEIQITSKNSLLVTANNVTTADLTSVGGPSNGWVVAGLVYEIDIATNEVLFSWNSLDHLDQLPFTDTLYPLGIEGFSGKNQSLAWGYFHINSVTEYGSGYLISSRYFCSAIAIDASDGSVVWRLSGRTGGDFELVGSDETTGFCYQHDIRPLTSTPTTLTLSMHDNHNSPIENNTIPSTGKILTLDFTSKTASLVQRLLNTSGPVYSTAQGNYQVLSDDNVFIGHGWIPIMEEYSSTGEIVSTIQFGAAEPRPGGGFVSNTEPTLSYRAFKQQWIGCPSSKPDVVAKALNNGTEVHVSWNGATEVTAWDIYGSSSNASLALITTAPKTGFETKAVISGSVEYVSVAAELKAGCECTGGTESNVVAVM